MNSEKKLLTLVLLCFFLGPFGVHRFYLGRNKTGILMLLTYGGLGVWSVIDLAMLMLGKFKDKQGKPISRWS
ncbi:TM2 domain-containing protein [Burkholderia sp. A1]|uniref:TM2 domain-containing protein n=1 Tax=Burkholderia sp. A1 TaxID=148446 RepID=UPI00046A8AF8|nr:TM2 domain-containing protein [Burkholderia sp. A1]